MSSETDIDFVFLGMEMADDIFGAEAVADGGDFLVDYPQLYALRL